MHQLRSLVSSGLGVNEHYHRTQGGAGDGLEDEGLGPGAGLDPGCPAHGCHAPWSRTDPAVFADNVHEAETLGTSGGAPFGRVFETGLEGPLPGELDDPGRGHDDALVDTQVTNIVLFVGIKALVCFVVGHLAPRANDPHIRSAKF